MKKIPTEPLAFRNNWASLSERRAHQETDIAVRAQKGGKLHIEAACEKNNTTA